MRFCAVLNRDGGTLRTADVDALAAHMRDVLVQAGHDVEVRAVDGTKVADALREAIEDSNADVILAAGGDGTVSLAAGLLAGTDKALAILPAGTMNLYARSLGLPLDLEMALAALASGVVRSVDVAYADGRPFVHQFSIGMHPQLIGLRSAIPFRSRLGKLAASVRAALTTLLKPHNLKVALNMGGAELITVTSGIGITNNLFGEGHLPYADRPDGGVLGIYITRAERRIDLIAFVFNMALGRWRDNEQVEIHEAGEVRLRILSAGSKFRCAIDGELCPLNREVHIWLRPRSLRVLLPRQS